MEVVAADASCAEDALQVWGGRHLDAVLHAAGVLTDAMLPSQDLQRLRR